VLFYVFLCCSMYCLFCLSLSLSHSIVCVYMCTVLLPPGGYTIAVNKYIISRKSLSQYIGMCLPNGARIAQSMYPWMTEKYFKFMIREEIFPFPIASRPALGPNQPAFQWVRWSFRGDKATGAWSRPLTFSAEVKKSVAALLPPPRILSWHGQ